MTPHLHPRSRMTSSLFATTLAASFLVVGLPHVLPCPAPRVSYADSAYEVSPDGAQQQQQQQPPRRRVVRRRPRPRPQEQAAEVKDGIAQFGGEVPERIPGSSSDGSAGRAMTESEAGISSSSRRRERECPVPKPGGVIGELMGFGRKGDNGK